MDDQNRTRIIATLAPLSAVFPNWKPSPEAIGVYAIALGELDPELLTATVLSLLADPLEFMPTPGSIRAKAFELKAIQDGDPEPYAAWHQVMGTWNGRGDELHPLVKEAANMIGGVDHIGYSDNSAAERARFLAAYDEVIQKRRFWNRQLPQVQSYLLGEGLDPQLPHADPARITTDD